MKRLRRELQIFTLSALDVLAMATGTFVLIVVLIMPYYRKSFDAHAQIDDVRVAADTMTAEAEVIQRSATEDQAAAAAAQAQLEQLRDAMSALRETATAQESETRSTQEETAARQRRIDEMKELAERRVIDELDLVFVIDTTVSMEPTMRDLALSMRGIVRILERLVPSVRIGVVAYRDRDAGVAPLVTLPLADTDRSLSRILNFVSRMRISPRPSRTREEDLYLGLKKALSMRLRPSAKQTIVVIGDAATHRRDQRKALRRAQRYARSGERRNISALFVTTPASLSVGNIDRRFFVALAKAGGGAFNDHSGQLIESVLLSVLVD